MPGKGGVTEQHTYRHIESCVTFTCTMRELAEQVNDLNHGVHRFLSHLVDVRRELLEAKIKAYDEKGDDDIAEYCRRTGDPLMETILKLLNEGHY